MAKKIRVCLVGLLVSLVLVLSAAGCSFSDSQSEDMRIDESAFEFLDAVQEGSLAGLEPYLSGAALGAKDFQQGFEYACLVLDGSIESVETLPKMERYTVEKGRSSRYKLARYNVHGEQGDYYLEFEFDLKNEFDESKVGIHQVYFDLKERYLAELEAYREARAQADAENRRLPEWYYGATYERPGIYHPGWKEEDA